MHGDVKHRYINEEADPDCHSKLVFLLDLIYLAAVVSEVCALAEYCASTAGHTLHCQ